jgi:hypothetical protein
MWIEFVLGTLIVSVIYILHIMYLAVVPLYDIAAESDRVAVVASQKFFGSVEH